MNAELHFVLDTIQTAGDAVEKLRKNGFSSSIKKNLSPLTQADLLANDILKTNLLQRFPQDSWLSEETLDDEQRLQNKRVWIVDPIDGTREFIKNIPEYVISVALIEDHQPVIAAIYNPATKELFYAVKNQGAWLNGHPMHCTPLSSKKPVVLASRTEVPDGRWEGFKEKFELKIVGSIAYKLALVANGAADATCSLAPKNEWDIAAGSLIVQEAGGNTSDLDGHELKFNQKKILVNGVIACRKEMYQTIFKMLS